MGENNQDSPPTTSSTPRFDAARQAASTGQETKKPPLRARISRRGVLKAVGVLLTALGVGAGIAAVINETGKALDPSKAPPPDGTPVAPPPLDLTPHYPTAGDSPKPEGTKL